MPKYFFTKKLIVNAIYSASRLENLNITFPQTQTIIDGMNVNGVSTDDMQVILNLKNAWQWMLANHRSSFNLLITTNRCHGVNCLQAISLSTELVMNRLYLD